MANRSIQMLQEDASKLQRMGAIGKLLCPSTPPAFEIRNLYFNPEVFSSERATIRFIPLDTKGNQGVKPYNILAPAHLFAKEAAPFHIKQIFGTTENPPFVWRLLGFPADFHTLDTALQISALLELAEGVLTQKWLCTTEGTDPSRLSIPGELKYFLKVVTPAEIPLIGREHVSQEIENYLSRIFCNGVALVGETGSGKFHLIRYLMWRWQNFKESPLSGHALFELDPIALHRTLNSPLISPGMLDLLAQWLKDQRVLALDGYSSISGHVMHCIRKFLHRSDIKFLFLITPRELNQFSDCFQDFVKNGLIRLLALPPLNLTSAIHLIDTAFRQELEARYKCHLTWQKISDMLAQFAKGGQEITNVYQLLSTIEEELSLRHWQESIDHHD
jgi:hypothetical protein